MRAIIKYILLTAVRDWLFIGLLFSVIACLGVSFFLGDLALSEQNATQLSFLAGTTRFILIMGLVLFICFHIRRSFDNREVDFMISRPISRSTFLMSYFISFSILSICLLLPVILLIFVVFSPNMGGFLVWSLSILLELIIISTFAIFSSLILKSAVSSVLSCFAFYFISRLMGFAISNIVIPAKISQVGFNSFLEIVLKGVSAILPRLDQFGQSKWLIYGEVSSSTVYLIMMQSIIYVSLLLLMSIFDFNRKQF